MGYVNKGSVLAVGILFIALGTLAIAARFYIKYRRTRLGVEDWLALAAWLLVTGDAVVMIIGSATNTVGNHSAAIPADRTIWALTFIATLQFYFDIIQILALTCLKLSILWFYRGIFVGRVFQIASWALISIVAVWGLAFILARIFSCGADVKANFEFPGSMKCSHSLATYIALAASDVSVDLVILAIPVPLILSLQMPLHKRLGIVAILIVGMGATICGIARLSLFASILGPESSSNASTSLHQVLASDKIAIVSILMFWSMLEIGVGIIAICLPILYRLVRDVSLSSRIRSLFTRPESPGSDLSGNQPSVGYRSMESRFKPRSLLWRTGTSYGNHTGSGSRGQTDGSSEEYELRAPLSPPLGAKQVPSGTVPTVPPVPNPDPSVRHGRGQIWETKEIRQTFEIV
ncbi:hypothetical protein ASPBRDRAFT_197826 [Aspergillus brasiliensis CBS 101740]|uniref:Rhodopsin domain-containing protein n=1 Tax=Aspergillus brasiliensis (strain CBS 101740 / IMI 381727 / IBT 21946) TaxID=767769 RepID=A0A1L9UEP4_ASPBC|nr:hypothetical protein ASPBRDRAFT_197826 [Aspergillus brasiliensis CBS 101740]